MIRIKTKVIQHHNKTDFESMVDSELNRIYNNSNIKHIDVDYSTCYDSDMRVMQYSCLIVYY